MNFPLRARCGDVLKRVRVVHACRQTMRRAIGVGVGLYAMHHLEGS